MKLIVKRVLLALCLVLIVATAGWCIDPFKANKGGFGPKIKGLQLGMKLDGARVGASGGILNYEAYGAYAIFVNDERRINRILFKQEDFGAQGMNHREFVQEFMNAYDIPKMEGTSSVCRYRNLSEGWEVEYSFGDIEVKAISTEPKFD